VQTLTDPVSGASFPCSGAPFTGCVPLARHPADSSIISGGAPYPIDAGPESGLPPGLAFANSGTKQPKAELRIDQELSGGGRIMYSGGYAGTAGIIHTGIGPFDIQDGSYMAYGRVGYNKGALKIAAFGNFLDVEAPNLLLPDPDNPGGQVQLTFNTETYDFEIGHSTVVAGNNVLSYGGNVRRNNFEITLTPEAENRTELGAYFQDEIIWDRFRLSLGGRVDKFGNIDDPVFSPRVTAMFKPAQEHSIRLSFNRAFRSPSAVNNYLDQNIYAPADPIDFTGFLQACRFGLLPPGFCSLVPTQPVPLIVRNIGSDVASNDPTDRTLKEESLDALEISYTGTFGGRTTLGIAAYQNDTDNNINFVQVTPTPNNPQGLPGFDVYTLDNPPPGIPAPVYAALLPITGPLARTVSTYLNLGPIRQRGLEMSLDHRFNKDVSAFVNYSFQDDPEVLDADEDQIPYPPEEVGLPSRHRFNIGFNLNSDRFIANASLNYTDKAFWQDVLSLPFHGYTDSFTMLNASFGVKFAEGKVTALVKGTNLTNETIQQHVYGDIIKRSLFAELRIFID
jgi:outer membrane receptor protein involved in Fe transport